MSDAAKPNICGILQRDPEGLGEPHVCRLPFGHDGGHDPLYAGPGSQPSIRSVLKGHYLALLECDPEAETDQAYCWCSLVDLGVHPSVGAAVDSWIDHVMEKLNG